MAPLPPGHDSQQDQGGLEDSSALKLPLFSLPRKPREQPRMASLPPLHTAASVPFRWEEAPGRPRPSCAVDSKPTTARSLELPPRLLSENKMTVMPSPTTVLDGPYLGRSLSKTWSFRTPPDGGSKRWEVRDKLFLFGSARWGLPKDKSGGLDRGDDCDPFSILEEDSGGVDNLLTGAAGGETKMKSRRSQLSLSHTKSHLWASIYEGIKQVAPWRRWQQTKKKKKTSHDPESLC